MTDHYYSASPKSRHTKHEISVVFDQETYIFATDSQVFSKAHVDKGSGYLLDAVLDAEGRLLEDEKTSNDGIDLNDRDLSGLDLGTGYGPIGIVLAKALKANMVMSDVNQRALDLAKENAIRNGVADHTTIVESDGFEKIKADFDFIVTNPPIRIGKQAIYAMWDEAFDHLKAGGRLYMVIRKKQGAESAVKKLKTLSTDVVVLAKKKGYWMIRLTKQEENHA